MVVVVVGSCVLIIDKKLQKSSSSNKQYGQFTQTGRWAADRLAQALPARPEALSCVSCEEMSFSPREKWWPTWWPGGVDVSLEGIQPSLSVS